MTSSVFERKAIALVLFVVLQVALCDSEQLAVFDYYNYTMPWVPRTLNKEVYTAVSRAFQRSTDLSASYIQPESFSITHLSV